MRSIKPHLTPIFEHNQINEKNLVESDGVFIDSFFELRKQMAQLACANSDFILFFRGQKRDYTDILYRKGGSSFFPSIYRGNISDEDLHEKWTKLEIACKLFAEKIRSYKESLPKKSNERKELDIVLKKRLLQWSILQHYEVTDTPLLDVTQSLRVACSFAFLDSHEEYSYIYAFGLPYNTGRISINSEHYLTNIRLISIAPSGSLRPHYQEGFLVGEDEINEREKKNITLDFRRRLIGKFRIPNNDSFWKSTTNTESFEENLIERGLTKKELYPDLNNHDDIIAKICNLVKEEMSDLNESEKYISQNPFEGFMFVWKQIESGLRDVYGIMHDNSKFSALKAIRFIQDKELRDKLNRLRIWRNNLVHGGVDTREIPENINTALLILKELQDYLNSPTMVIQCNS